MIVQSTKFPGGAGVKTFIGAEGGGEWDTEWGGGCGPKNSTCYDRRNGEIY